MALPLRLNLNDRVLHVDLREIGIDAEGTIVSKGAREPIDFDFVYHGVPFGGRMTEDAGHVVMKLVGRAGPLPFSAEDSTARVNVQAIIDAADAALGGPVFRVSRDGQILIGHEFSLRLPVTAVAIVSAVTGFLLRIAPYLECVAAFVTPPAQVPRPVAPGRTSRPARRPAVGKLDREK